MCKLQNSFGVKIQTFFTVAVWLFIWLPMRLEKRNWSDGPLKIQMGAQRVFMSVVRKSEMHFQRQKLICILRFISIFSCLLVENQAGSSARDKLEILFLRCKSEFYFRNCPFIKCVKRQLIRCETESHFSRRFIIKINFSKWLV